MLPVFLLLSSCTMASPDQEGQCASSVEYASPFDRSRIRAGFTPQRDLPPIPPSSHPFSPMPSPELPHFCTFVPVYNILDFTRRICSQSFYATLWSWRYSKSDPGLSSHCVLAPPNACARRRPVKALSPQLACCRIAQRRARRQEIKAAQRAALKLRDSAARSTST